MKYLWRYRYKNGIEDLKKAQWYLNKLIEVNDADQSVLDFKIDEDEYPVPVDGQIKEEVNETLQEFIYDIDGMMIKAINILTE